MKFEDLDVWKRAARLRNLSIGVYFERDRIDLLCVRKTLKEISIRGFESTALQGVDEHDVYGKPREFIKQNGGDGANIFIALPRRDTTLLFVDLPAPTEENLRDVLGYELDRYTPYSREDAYFSFQIVGRDEEKKTIRVLLLVILKKRLDDCLNILAKINISPKNVEVTSTALIETIRHNLKEIATGRHVIMNVDKEIDEVILIENGLLQYSRTFPVRPTKRMDSLYNEIRRALDTKGWGIDGVEGLILNGEINGNIYDFINGLSKMMKKKVMLFESLQGGPTGEALSARYMVPFGLALRGVGKDSPHVDLLPHTKKTEKKRAWYPVMLPAIILIFIVGFGLLFIPLMRAQKRLKDVTGKISRLQPDKAKLEKLEEDINELEKRYTQLASMRGGKTKILLLFKELTEIIPGDSWLTVLRYKRGKVEIEGYARSASSLIALIENSEYFAEVSFSAPVTVTDKEKAFKTGRGRTTSPFIGRGEVRSVADSGSQVERFRIKAVLEAEL